MPNIISFIQKIGWQKENHTRLNLLIGPYTIRKLNFLKICLTHGKIKFFGTMKTLVLIHRFNS